MIYRYKVILIFCLPPLVCDQGFSARPHVAITFFPRACLSRSKSLIRDPFFYNLAILVAFSQTRPRRDLSGILHLPSQKHYSNTSPKLVLHFQTRPSAAADLLIFSPTSPLPFIILNTSLASKIFCRTTPWQQCCWWGTSPLLSFLEFEDVL